MKNTKAFFVLAVLLIAGSISAYAEGSSEAPSGTARSGGATPQPQGGGTFTVTGIPSQYNGMYAYLLAGHDEGAIRGAERITPREGLVKARISGGRVVMPVWLAVDLHANEFVRFTGNGTAYGVNFYIDEQAEPMDVVYVYVHFREVSFTNGSATVPWSAGE